MVERVAPIGQAIAAIMSAKGVLFARTLYRHSSPNQCQGGPILKPGRNWAQKLLH
jgi:hypothetical protein